MAINPEYLRLLSAARDLGRERLYLAIKTIGSTGITISQMLKISVEMVRQGRIYIPGKNIHIPSVLCKELLEYATRHGIVSGAIFVTRNGVKVNRSNLFREIKNLAPYAQVEEEKCTPIALRRMYQESVREITEMLAGNITEQIAGQGPYLYV